MLCKGGCCGYRELFLNSLKHFSSRLLNCDDHGTEHDEEAQECGGSEASLSQFRERSLRVGER
jgi:hypothetical protein